MSIMEMKSVCCNETLTILLAIVSASAIDTKLVLLYVIVVKFEHVHSL